jgi:hypothetical protein
VKAQSAIVSWCPSINGHFALTLRCFEKFNPRNIKYMPVVKFIKRLDLEQNISFMDKTLVGITTAEAIKQEDTTNMRTGPNDQYGRRALRSSCQGPGRAFEGHDQGIGFKIGDGQETH